MDQGEQTWSEAAQVTGPRIWRTTEVDPGEAFDYYHEGICSAFMPLRPELERSLRRGFQATHYAYGIGASTLNMVSAQSHLVQRGPAEIAASSEDCYYLNFQLAGDCHITQNGTDIVLLPGDVGLFDSSQNFGLHHDTFPELKVASLMLPKHSIGANGADQPARTPQLLSRHPVYGRLITEAMQTLVETITAGNHADIAGLQSLVISLLELTGRPDRGHSDAGASALTDSGAITTDSARGAAQLLRVKRIIRARCTTPGYSVAACARETALSERYIHRLFEGDEDSFGTFLIRERLTAATRMLRHPNTAHLPTSTIATESGFSDPSHFHRAFRSRYGMTPGYWRRR
ncbi:helix-turn-helix domain-containing protein [Hoeflea sp. AS16]|uniref:helix-turn-helix domain-containing protein n=1 Tax=Hoeflea sp. AS16 TaxID=3135779 RepID=UPI00316B3800